MLMWFQKHWITAIFKRPPVGMSKPFARFEDLLYQSEYVYGTVIRSSVDRFFGVSFILVQSLSSIRDFPKIGYSMY